MNKYLFWRNKYRRPLVNRSRNLDTFFLEKKITKAERPFLQRKWYTWHKWLDPILHMFLTFTARSNSVQRSLISEKGLLNDSLKIQGKTLEEKFSNPFSPFSWCLFVHAFSVFPSNSRNSSREVTSLVCKPHRSLMVSISLGKSSSSFMIPGSILSEES